MTKGTSETLTVTGTPAEALEGQTITWKSSNKDVVTVDSKGKVEAVGVGNATITATAAGKSDSVKDHSKQSVEKNYCRSGNSYIEKKVLQRHCQ